MGNKHQAECAIFAVSEHLDACAVFDINGTHHGMSIIFLSYRTIVWKKIVNEHIFVYNFTKKVDFLYHQIHQL